MEEIWIDVNNFEGLYQISSLGRVKTKRDGKVRVANTNGIISLGTHPFKIDSLMLQHFPDVYIRKFKESTTKENEIWKDINGYEGLYQVSTLGRVRSMPRVGKEQHITRFRKNREESFKKSCVTLGGILVPIKTGFPNKDGVYRQAVALLKNNKSTKYQVHRLVAEAFLPNPNNLPEVNHKNRDVTDNTLNNLEWVTKKDNIEHALLEQNSIINLYELANSEGVSPSDMIDKLISMYKKE